ncbi:hypothetical protein [Amorphus orientalis]|uniref:Uncharacterized protein n=1 Tax=Amorphus orientalis TaxID=649198 RepID=A0AAE4ATX9_9HYPH|nr:hypothetical protein [Amorphus orientalis]MDQ0317756.1 hypothetical protein [Amorphus orientalis]
MPDRGTGRTTQLLREGLRHIVEGHNVTFIVPNQVVGDYVFELAQHLAWEEGPRLPLHVPSRTVLIADNGAKLRVLSAQQNPMGRLHPDYRVVIFDHSMDEFVSLAPWLRRMREAAQDAGFTVYLS